MNIVSRLFLAHLMHATVLALAITAFALPLSNVAAAGDAAVVEKALLKAAKAMHSLAIEGGYAGIYRLSNGQRYGEATYDELDEAQIFVQPPGTPSVGACYLRAYRVTGNRWYADAANDAGLALAWAQSMSGGWNRVALVGPRRGQPDDAQPVRYNYYATLDDDTSQGVLKFLIELQQTLPQKWQTKSVRDGLAFLLKSQYPNGAWPQGFPAMRDYRDFYTFNDGAINHAITVMLLAYDTYGDVRYLQSARAGLNFILLSQMASPNPVWAQQYDFDLNPVQARPFEPPAYSSTATRRNIRSLLVAYLRFGTTEYEKALFRAADWLAERKIGNNLWARFYDFNTLRPLYADPKGRTYTSMGSLPAQIRSRYQWQGNFGIPGTLKDVASLAKQGRKKILQKAEQDQTQRNKRLYRRAKRKIPEILADLDGQGRWIRGAKVYAGDFANNCHIMLDFLSRAPS